MYVEIEKFGKWLRRKTQHTTTYRHYTGDLRIFFAWANRSTDYAEGTEFTERVSGISSSQ